MLGTSISSDSCNEIDSAKCMMGYDVTSLFTSNIYKCYAPKDTMQSGVWALMFWRNILPSVAMEMLVVVTSCRLKVETVSLSQTLVTQLPDYTI
jgi:hypothetical protein